MKTCSVDGCGVRVYSKNLCKRHYEQIRIKGYIVPEKTPEKCSVEWCDSVASICGYCKKHYQQARNFGAPKRTYKDRNDIIIHGEYAEIVLYSKECEIVGYTKIDLDEVENTRPHKWYLGNKGYVCGTVFNKDVLLHRYLFDSDILVDHINRDKLDNRKSNLRSATYQQNAWNSCKCSNNSTGYKGVSPCDGRFRAGIKIDGKERFIGLFDTPEKAAMAYNEIAQKIHGEFACLSEV